MRHQKRNQYGISGYPRSGIATRDRTSFGYQAAPKWKTPKITSNSSDRSQGVGANVTIVQLELN